MAGAGCILISRNTGRFLVGRRSAIESLPGTWGIPGGMCDPGEDVMSTVIREVYEETGYNLDKNTPIDYLGMTTEKNGFQFHTFLKWVDYEFTPIKSPETDKFKWVRRGKDVSPLHPELLDAFRHPTFLDATSKDPERAKKLGRLDRILLRLHQVSVH